MEPAITLMIRIVNVGNSVLVMSQQGVVVGQITIGTREAALVSFIARLRIAERINIGIRALVRVLLPIVVGKVEAMMEKKVV